MTAPMPDAGRSRAATIRATTLGFAVVQLDGAMLNIALVDIGRSLGIAAGALQWLVNAHTVAFVCLLVSAGAIGDRIGAGRVFRCGFVMFTLAAIAAAASTGFWFLTAARIVQGVGAALLVPSSLALLNRACGGDEAARAKAVAGWAAAGGVAVAVGPAVSGLLVGWAGWRSIFLIAAAVAAAGFGMATKADPGRDPGTMRRGFDWTGQALAILALASLIAAIAALGGDGGPSPGAIAGILVAALSLAGFLRAEARAAHPIMPPAVLRDRRVAAVMATGFAVSFAIFGLVFALALQFQQVRVYSPIMAGLAFVPFSLAIVATNLLAGRIAAAVGAERVMLAGLGIAIAGFAALALVLGRTSYAEELPAQIVARIGIGLVVPTATTLLLASIPRAIGGVASGAFTAIRQAGAALGVATYGTLLASDPDGGLRAAVAISAALLVAALCLSLAGFGRHPVDQT